MDLLICGDENQISEIRDSLPHEVENIRWINDLKSCGTKSFDAILALNSIPDETFFSEHPSAIVFVNEVIHTNAELKLPSRVIRMNGWPGFLGRRVWEAAGEANDGAVNALQALGKELIFVKDIPGLVSARVIVSIIAEAFLALDEGVSSKEEIDLAMKLGTNYPFGPFEWNEKIGEARVRELSNRLGLSEQTER